MNPLLHDFDTPFDSVPFEKIKLEHYLPAMEQSISEALGEVEKIAHSKAVPNFENTVLALENVGQRAGRVAEVFFNLNSAETSDAMQSLARDISPLLTRYRNDIILNPTLYQRFETLWQQRSYLGLDPEQMRLLEKSYRSFVRNGAALKLAEQERLRALDEELAGLSLQFGENLLAETNAYQLFLERSELKGLPDSALESAAQEAKEAGQPGKYLVSLHAPSYLAVMTYAEDRALREKLFRAYGSRAFKGDERDNQATVKKIVKLRQQRAKLLGYPHHAAYVLEERMAKSLTKVQDFTAELQSLALPAARRELAELTDFARSLGGPQKLQRWDFNFYSEKLKQERYAVNDELLKPYFELNRVVEGVFAVAQKLYGLRFVLRHDIEKYHPDVKTYQVLEADASHLALFYADFFPRPGKRNGAWMTSYRSQFIAEGEDQRPHVSIVCNFTKPTAKNPSLLSFNEVLTLFHEFGHSLHGMLARGRYASLSGTNVLWDFVELPSQIMENWCYEKECLDFFAVHYQTGEPIPAELVERLRKSATFMEGYATLRQLSLAKLDLAWHSEAEPQVEAVGDFEREIFAETDLFEPQPDTNMSCTFGHIFQGGYSAGYYSYKWAEVLDADAFALFAERGLFDEETAKRFRHLLESGDAMHPAELYRRFRGKDPDPKALLRRAGLLKEE